MFGMEQQRKPDCLIDTHKISKDGGTREGGPSDLQALGLTGLSVQNSSFHQNTLVKYCMFQMVDPN